jgi:hypothetical protein
MGLPLGDTMGDDGLEEYAQLENNHILLQLVGARPPTGEDPLALAERNVTATEQSFGRQTALHAMALNTHAFALLYKSQNGTAAQAQADAAVAILKALGGQDEMLLEARVLAAHARMLAGAKPAEAVAEAFELPGGAGGSVTHIDEILKRAVESVPLERQVLLMSLREIATRLAEEPGSGSLVADLVRFLERYFGRAG